MAEHLASIYGTEKDKYTSPYFIFHLNFFVELTVRFITRLEPVVMVKSALGSM